MHFSNRKNDIIRDELNEVKMIDEALKMAMSALVNVLRELLANMEEEQYAIMAQNAPAFQVIMNSREPLLNSMQAFRGAMVQEINKLKDLHPEHADFESDQERLKNLARLAGADNIELLTLRDQILALSEQMEKQNTYNKLLLGNQQNESDPENYSHQYKPRLAARVKPQKISGLPKQVLQTIERAVEEN